MISEALRTQFAEDGFCVVEDALDAPTLALLRRESDLAVASQEAAYQSGGSVVGELNQRGQRYFVQNRSTSRPALRAALLGEAMARLCGGFLAPDAYLFLDVFVCKTARSESLFEWHQDYGYLVDFGYGHYAPNVTFWAPLDDVTEDNGALRVLPFSRGGTRQVLPHRWVEGSNDRVADFGGAPGEVVPMRAGSLLLMSGVLPHMSGPNRTDAPRRAYLWQYSLEPVLDQGKPIMLAEPLLRDGCWVGASQVASPAPA
jgi:ectoine hydroxylase-related dioxygenase (phytanoyl-CoA dioxygenase family)